MEFKTARRKQPRIRARTALCLAGCALLSACTRTGALGVLDSPPRHLQDDEQALALCADGSGSSLAADASNLACPAA